ncbi:MAG TPA: NACHT domain-containing protein [Umezawaea sp.]|nr:NACHT domain-containing protein [Umezawaea sp.]
MAAEPAPRDRNDSDSEGKVEQVGVASTSGTVVQAGRDAVVTVQHFHAGSARSGPVGRLDEAASQLAAAVRSQWVREVESRRAYDPRPLRVRWHPAPVDLVDHQTNLTRQHDGPPLAGELAGIVELYRQVPEGRMLVLGRPGSGKTILAVHFLLTVLSSRDLVGGRIPVLFSLGSWNPAMPLRDWLAEQLARDYPIGLRLATDLVEDKRVLPVLDGFDEIADGLHAGALERLNATTMPLVVTSRPDEFRSAIEATARRLSRAVVVELEDLTPADRADYLTRTTHRTVVLDGRTVPLWDPVLEHDLDSTASRNLAQALSTPLMVGLARTVYGESTNADPQVLLDVERFPTARHVEQHLLASWVPSVYRSPDHADRAEHWLGFLARHLRRSDTPNLTWWRLDNSVPWALRALLTSVTIGAVAAGWAALVLGSPIAFLLGFPVAASVALAVDVGWPWLRALGAFLIGLAFGMLLVHGASDEVAAFFTTGDGVVRPLGMGLLTLGLNRIAGRSAPVPSYLRFRGRPRPGEIWRKARFAVVGALLGELFTVYLTLVPYNGVQDAPLHFASTRFVLASAAGISVGLFIALLWGVTSDFSVRLRPKQFIIIYLVAIILYSWAELTAGTGSIPIKAFPGFLLFSLAMSLEANGDAGTVAKIRKQLVDSKLAGYVVVSGVGGSVGGAVLGVVGAVTGSYPDFAGDEQYQGWLGVTLLAVVCGAGGALFGTVAAIVARAARVITDFEGTINLKNATSPPRSLAMDRTNAVVQSTAVAVTVGALTWAVLTAATENPRNNINGALLVGGIAGIVLLLSGKAWGRWLVMARFWLPLAEKVPWRLTRFLADAQRRGVLRQAGAVHQFRHARLQDHYAQAHASSDSDQRDQPGVASARPTPAAPRPDDSRQ